MYTYILYQLCYIKYNDILIYVYLALRACLHGNKCARKRVVNYNNIVQYIINIIWKIKFYKII